MIAPFAHAGLVFFFVTAVIALPVIAIAPLPELRMFGMTAVLASIAGFALNAVALGPDLRAAVASILVSAWGRLREARATAALAMRRPRAPATDEPTPGG